MLKPPQMSTGAPDRGTMSATKTPPRRDNVRGPAPKGLVSMRPQNTATAPRVEKAPARGQRISRQPWKAWNRHGRFLGVFATKVDAVVAAETDDRPRPSGAR